MMLTVALFVLLALLFLSLGSIMASGDGRKLAARVQRVREGSMPGVPKGQVAAAASVRRRPARTLLGNAGHQLGSMLPRSRALRRRLDQAGVSLSVIDGALICLAVGCGTVAFLVVAYEVTWWLAVGIGVCVASGAPHLWLRWRINRRRRQFISEFPDAIDLIVRSVKSGLPVTESLQSAGEELSNQVGQLFQEITGKIKLGKSLDEALLEASQKIPIPEVKFFAISLAIQQETGGNLAEILQNLVNLMRRRAQMKLKIRAMSSEARASAMIIGSLPFFMFAILYCINSAYIMKLFDSPGGHMLIAAGATSLVAGLAVMSKMVRFEI